MKSEFFNPNSKPSYALMSTISGHALKLYSHNVSAVLVHFCRELRLYAVEWHDRPTVYEVSIMFYN